METAYFEEFLPTLFGRPLVPGNENLNTAFVVSVAGSEGRRWRLVVNEGRLEAVERNDDDAPVTFTLSLEILAKLVRGELSPVNAFLANDIQIDGDVEQGLVLGAILEAFFQAYPYDH